MSTFIPKNAAKILKNDKMMRQYALNPYGYKIPKNCNFPKKHPQYKFFEHNLLLHRSSKRQKIDQNVLVFKVDQEISKPELKQYIQKLYKLDIDKINTARFMGKVVRNQFGRFETTKNFKKAFVVAKNQVHPILNQSID